MEVANSSCLPISNKANRTSANIIYSLAHLLLSLFTLWIIIHAVLFATPVAKEVYFRSSIFYQCLLLLPQVLKCFPPISEELNFVFVLFGRLPVRSTWRSFLRPHDLSFGNRISPVTVPPSRFQNKREGKKQQIRREKKNNGTTFQVAEHRKE